VTSRAFFAIVSNTSLIVVPPPLNSSAPAMAGYVQEVRFGVVAPISFCEDSSMVKFPEGTLYLRLPWVVTL